MSSDDAPTFDALETRRACRALLPTLDLERATERSVREAVRDALRAARGDDGRDVDRIVVQNEIDAFLGRADAAVAANEDGARGATTTATTKRERVDDEGSPTIGGNKRASATAEESALDETRVLAALEAIGEDGTEAKALAIFLKRDKTAVNKALYAMAARGTARREDGEGGAPRWFVANARVRCERGGDDAERAAGELDGGRGDDGRGDERGRRRRGGERSRGAVEDEARDGAKVEGNDAR
jgi:hypothetical protein